MSARPDRRLARPRRRRRPGDRRPAVRRRHPPARTSSHAKLVTLACRPGPHHRDRHERRRCARPGRPPRHDGRRPAPADAALRARSSRTGRSSPSARRSTTASRWRPSRPRRRTRPRRRPRLVRVEYEELPAVFTIAAALDPAAPLVQDPALRPDDPARRHERPPRAPRRLGRRRRGDRPTSSSRTRYTFPMVTHFAIEPHAFMAAPGRRRDRRLELDPAPQLAPEDHRQDPRPAARPRSGSSPRTRAAASAASSTPSTSRSSPSWPSAAGPAGAPRPDPRGDVPGGPPRGGRGPRPDRLPAGRHARLPGHRRRLPASGPTPTSPTASSARAATRPAGPYRVPAARIVARSILSHTVPSTAFRGFGNPQVNWAVESNLDEAARALGIDPLELRLRNLARRARRSSPFDTPADGDWEQTVRRAAELIGWGTPLPPGHGRGIAVGIKSGPTTGLSYSTVRLLADGSVIVYAGTSDMGQGARTVFAQIAAAGARRAARLGHGRHGRHGRSCPYDQQTSASRSTVLMGNAVLAGLPRRSRRKLRAMAARLHGLDEAAIVVDARRRPPARPRAVDPRRAQARPRPARRRADRQRRDRARRPSRTIRSAGARPSSSSTARPSRPTVDEETGDITIVRHVDRLRRRQGPQPAPGPDAGRGRRDPGPRPHAHGALHLRRRRAGSGTSARSTTGSRRAWTCRSSCVSEIVENEDGPGPYGSKGMSEGALLCVAAGRRRRGPRRDRRRRSATCRSRRSASGGPSRSGRRR